jgi:hypothetical protein
MNPYARHADDDTAQFELAEPAPVAPMAVEPGSDVDLAEDPFADDLADRLDAAAPRRWAGRTTVALAGLVLLVGGFLAGTQVEKRWGKLDAASSSTTTNPFAAFAQGRTGGTGTGGTGTGGAGTGAGTGGAARGTTGTVKLVDGTTVYLTTSSGQTVIVKTSGSTTVEVAQAGSLKDLAPGATVTVQGQTGSDGSVSATRITATK